MSVTTANGSVTIKGIHGHVVARSQPAVGRDLAHLIEHKDDRGDKEVFASLEDSGESAHADFSRETISWTAATQRAQICGHSWSLPTSVV